jgi:hypothetical protein
MTVMHHLVGYDRATEHVTVEHNIPAERFAIVRGVVAIAPTDPDAVGCYPVDPPTAEEIGKIIGAPIDAKRLDYVLEPVP